MPFGYRSDLQAPTRPNNKRTKKPLERILKLFEGNTRVGVKLLMILLLKLSKKVGFRIQEAISSGSDQVKKFRIRPDSDLQRPDHTTIKISQQKEDHNNISLMTTGYQKIMIFSPNETSSQHAELVQCHLLASTAYRRRNG
jgi:hypothetical protein